MNRILVLALLSLLVINGLLGQPRPSNWAVKRHIGNLTNLYQLNDTLFRSEQPDHNAFIELQKAGLRSVLNLREKHSDSSCTEHLRLNLYSVNMDVREITERQIVDALKVIKSAPKPLLIHCRHGADRTGAVLAMYRVVFGNWTKEDALNEMIHGGYNFHEKYTNIPVFIRDANIARIKELVLAN